MEEDPRSFIDEELMDLYENRLLGVLRNLWKKTLRPSMEEDLKAFYGRRP